MKKNKKLYHVINISIITGVLVLFLIFIQNQKIVNLYHYDGDNQWLTASTIKFVNNWLKDGIINDKFIMYEDFKSIEFENDSREIYNSYPPGCIIPVYIFAKIIGLKEISIQNMKSFIFYEYILCSIFIGIFFYIFSYLINFRFRYLIVLFPIILALIWAYLPFNYYYFRNVYFSDIAIIPISILFLTIELVKHNKSNSRFNKILNLISFLLILIGVLTDYYFLSLTFSCFLSRFIFLYKENNNILKGCLNTIGKSKDVIFGILIGISLFVYQLMNIPDGFKKLINKFTERTSSSIDNTMFINHDIILKSESIFTKFRLNFGSSIPSIIMYLTLVILILTIINVIINKKYNLINYFLLIITFSCVLHSILLYNHTMRHEFSILKFCIILVFIIFYFMYYILNLLFNYQGKIYKAFFLFSLVLTIPFIYYLIYWDNKYYIQRTRQINIENENLSNFIRNNTNYKDVVFSPYFEINTNPPLNLSISQKRVYKINSLMDINEFKSLKKINVLILLKKDSVEKYKDWVNSKSSNYKQYKNWILIKN